MDRNLRVQRTTLIVDRDVVRIYYLMWYDNRFEMSNVHGNGRIPIRGVLHRRLTRIQYYYDVLYKSKRARGIYNNIVLTA